MSASHETIATNGNISSLAGFCVNRLDLQAVLTVSRMLDLYCPVLQRTPYRVADPEGGGAKKPCLPLLELTTV